MLVDCVWNDWDNWSSCSKLCGSGQQSRTRTTKVAAQGGGKECIGPKKSTKVCNAQVCIGNEWHFNPSTTITARFSTVQENLRIHLNILTLDGKWGNWGPWNFNRCVSSQGCKKTSLRQCNNPIPSLGGKQCVGNNIRAAGKLKQIIYDIPTVFMPGIWMYVALTYLFFNRLCYWQLSSETLTKL